MDDSKDNGVSRRDFMKRAAAGAAAIGLAGMIPSGIQAAEGLTSGTAATAGAGGSLIPLRTLGNTGARISMLGFGGGSRFLIASEEQGAAMLERAVELGITYFDTASSYGKDRASEKRYGEVLPKYRDKIFLTTKTADRTYDGMMKSVEESLAHLKTDHLDLMQMHDVGPKDDPAAWEKPDGALTALRKLRDQKVIRFIGFTGHQKAEVHRNIIEKLDYDTVLMALNAADHKSFREVALPAAEKKNMGIIAMKVTRGLVGEGEGKSTPAELLSWAFSLPISTVIVGMETLEQIDQNVQQARVWAPGKTDVAALTRRITPHASFEQVSWAMPDYRDA